MLHWIAIILGIIFTLFQLFYAFIVICSLIENTGYKILSVVFGICHAISPVLFVFFGYQCLLRKIAQYGVLKAGIGIVVCLVIYFFVVLIWNRIVLGYTPETWKISLLTIAQVIVSAIFIYGFLYFQASNMECRLLCHFAGRYRKWNCKNSMEAS